METLELLKNLKHVVEKDIQKTVEKGTVEPNEWCNLGEAVDIVKDIYEIYDFHYKMEDATQVQNYYSDDDRYFANPQDLYEKRASRTQRWDTPSVRRPSYANNDQVKTDLNELLNSATNDHERMLIMRIMDNTGHHNM